LQKTKEAKLVNENLAFDLGNFAKNKRGKVG